MQREHRSIRLAPAERGEATSHAEAPPGPHSKEQHTWHVPRPPLNPDHTVPPSQSIPPNAPQQLGPVSMLSSEGGMAHIALKSPTLCVQDPSDGTSSILRP